MRGRELDEKIKDWERERERRGMRHIKRKIRWSDELTNSKREKWKEKETGRIEKDVEVLIYVTLSLSGKQTQDTFRIIINLSSDCMLNNELHITL